MARKLEVVMHEDGIKITIAKFCNQGKLNESDFKYLRDIETLALEAWAERKPKEAGR